jgi:hypothetical protein
LANISVVSAEQPTAVLFFNPRAPAYGNVKRARWENVKWWAFHAPITLEAGQMSKSMFMFLWMVIEEKAYIDNRTLTTPLVSRDGKDRRLCVLYGD